MKYVLLFLLLCRLLPVRGQNYLTRNGAFMDTATNLKQYAIIPYYYNVGGKYPRSSTTLLKEVQAYIKVHGGSIRKADRPGGYITFRFMIDTSGKMDKRVQVIQTDEEYRDRPFNPIFVGLLYDYTRTLDQWKIVRLRSGRAFDYMTLISFKIHDGKVVNIIP